MSLQKKLCRDIVFLMIQFMKEEKFDETVHKLEKESGVFFDMSYFDSLVTNGEWEKVEEYLSGFMKVNDNPHSTKILFEIRKHKYLEALDNHDHEKAVAILTKELKVFSTYSEAIYKNLTLLLNLGDFREHSEFSSYSDKEFARRAMLVDVKKLIRENPVFHDKLEFPTLKNSRLKTLLNHSLNWQHFHCKSTKPISDVKTLFVDHYCEEQDGVLAQSISANPVVQTTRTVRADGISSTAADGPENAYFDRNGDGTDLSKHAENLAISATWNMTEISEQSQLRSLKLPDHLLSVKVIRLMYANSGKCILALMDNAVHNLWKWEQNERNVTGQATVSVPPQLYLPRSGILMTNDLSEAKLEDAVPCLALTKNDSYVVSASGGKFSIFNIITFRVLSTFMPPPPAATCVVIHPEDSNVVAVGMEDSSIRIYNVRLDQVMHFILGHRKRVTGLAFSIAHGILVSSGADGLLCVWSVGEWKSMARLWLQIPPGYATEPLAQTRVQFHKDQTLVLVVRKSQIAVYKAPTMDRKYQWVAEKSNGAITDATYSSDGKSVYASFIGGSVSVFTAFKLTLRCRINPTSYLPSTIPSLTVYPLVIAAHPCKPNQFAIGLSDGGVYVLEPLEKQGTWGICA